ncbi:FtsX-like permease family protein [Nocardioides sp. BP30]|uniref:ABC transporter permease n=1 Tax=Nocardioides sp. BP30 TaxID=3036374 RepID=UPI00246931B9|nr:FtsX-like permease family protein [Nocardioides sp. BP30]WGL50686.1 FtsX-like permease family protein [Nocardioides sp. BP30]
MLRLVLRNLWARKVRLVMSGLAIVLGVAFLSGVLVFSNGLSSTFDSIIKGSTPDATVRAKGLDSFGPGDAGTPTATLGPDVVTRLAALPQVASARGSIDGKGMSLLDSHGALVGGTGAPTLAFNHSGALDMAGQPILLLKRGSWPGPGQLVLDEGSAKRAGYHVGDIVSLLPPTTSRQLKVPLVGTAEFNGGSTAGSTLLIFDTATAQRIFLGGRDAFTSVALTAAPGVSQTALVEAARMVLPADFEAVTGDQVVHESQDAISRLLDVISVFLLVFALIAVVVGAFIIVNTFTILVAQRTRELALLRALGATRRQITRSVLAEALAMSVVASSIGIALGWLLARGLAAVFRAAGLDIAGRVLTLDAASVLISYAVGVAVTLLAAWLPARRAGRVAPVTAMRGDLARTSAPLRARAVVAALLFAVGAVLAALAFLDAPGSPAAWVGAGALVWVLTLAASSSLVGRPVLVVCRAVFTRLFGATGRLAGENALRDPRRTGATASALMIGLALVSTIGVLAASLNSTVGDIVEEQFSSDFLVQSTTFAPFPTAIGDQLRSVPGVATVSRQQIVGATILDRSGSDSGRSTPLAGVDDAFTGIYRLEMRSGTEQLRGNGAVVASDLARQRGWHLGSPFELAFPAGRTLALTVTGISKPSAITAPISMRLALIAQAGLQRQDTSLSIMLAPGASAATVLPALKRVTDAAKIVEVYDKASFADQIRGQVDRLLYLIYGLLALAIVIAVIGIVNTLGLSVIERTREIGLLRAVGMSRARLRRMVTLESVAIALLGAVMGMVLGLLIGVLLRQALASQLTSLGLPLGQLALFLVVAVVVGILAAVLPAARAARLNVLAAITSE